MNRSLYPSFDRPTGLGEYNAGDVWDDGSEQKVGCRQKMYSTRGDIANIGGRVGVIRSHEYSKMPGWPST